MMAPITPHVAEELWSELGNKTLVSSASYPKPEAEHSALAAELAEEYLREVMDDTNNILRVTKIHPETHRPVHVGGVEVRRLPDGDRPAQRRES